MHPNHAFRHEDVDIVDQPQRAAPAFGKCAEPVLDDVDIAPAGVHPLRDIAEQRGGVLIVGIGHFAARPAGIEASHAAADAAHAQIVAQAFDQRVLANRNHVGSSVPDSRPLWTSGRVADVFAPSHN